jgi:hypothetical protein
MATWDGRLQYGNSSQTVNEPELAASALAEWAAGMTVDLTKSLYPTSLYSALRKEIAPSDRIIWSAALANSGANVGDVTDLVVSGSTFAPTVTPKSAYQVLSLEQSGFTKKVFDVISINNQSLALAQMRGTGSVGNLFETRLRATVTRIIEKINGEIFTGNGAAGIVGLEGLFSATTHGGVPHTLASYTGKTEGVDYFINWRPLSGNYDRSAKTLTLNDGHGAVSATVDTLVYDNMGDMLDLFTYELQTRRRRFSAIVTHPMTLMKLTADFRNAGNLHVSVQNGEVLRSELGAAIPTYNGVPFIADIKCPYDAANNTHTFYFIDLSSVVLYTYPLAQAPGAAGLAARAVDNGLYMAVGSLPNGTIAVQQYEILTLPMLFVEDTAAVSKLVVQP